MLTTASCALSQNRNYTNTDEEKSNINAYTILGVISGVLVLPVTAAGVVLIGPVVGVAGCIGAFSLGYYSLYKGEEQSV